MSYNFNNHRHNYAVWCAARAVQRGFTTTPIIKYAIEKSGLRAFAEAEQTIDNNDFEKYHKEWCAKMKKSFAEKEVKEVSYGRIAKIIAIYLKTSVILPNKGACERSKIIHPPIDSILLNKLSKVDGLSKVKNNRWTQLEVAEYWDLVKTIKSVNKSFDWRLEVYWNPERKS